MRDPIGITTNTTFFSDVIECVRRCKALIDCHYDVQEQHKNLAYRITYTSQSCSPKHCVATASYRVSPKPSGQTFDRGCQCFPITERRSIGATLDPAGSTPPVAPHGQTYTGSKWVVDSQLRFFDVVADRPCWARGECLCRLVALFCRSEKSFRCSAREG